METFAPLTKAERRERFMHKTRAEAGYVFKYLILTQIIVYLEAGAIPCLLDQLSVSLNLDATQQGALGGVVYLALSAASPLCAYFLHRFNPRIVLGLSLLCNNVAVLMLALTPTGYSYSANMLILARAAVGFTQAFPCIYTPLWVDEYAPREKVAGWMSYLQGSVPMGVMLGYFIGTVSNWLVPESSPHVQTWRWPFLLQFLALLPVNMAIFLVPSKHLIIRSDNDREATGSGGTESASVSSSDGCEDEVQSVEVEVDAVKTSVKGDDGDAEATREDKKTHNADGTLRFELEPLTYGLATVQSILTVVDYMFRDSLKYIDDFKLVVIKSKSTWQENTSSRFSTKRNVDEWEIKLCIWCLNAAVAFSDITRQARSVILTSGTLSPMESFVGELGVDFPIRLEANHVVNMRKQVFVGAVMHGPGNVNLQSTYDNQQNPRYQDSMGHLLLQYSQAIPGGILMFFPSYSLLNKLVSRWKKTKLWGEFIEVYEQGAFSDGLHELLRIPVFCLIVFGLTTVYFVVTGVQYWSTIFMIKSLHASKYLVNALFVVVSGTGPILGVFFGGWLIDRYGGYRGVAQRAKALGICMILGLTAFFISAVTTFFNDVFITSGFLWLLLFFGGSILPACTGIFISVVPAEHRAIASSFSVMVFNLFGYSLSPYLTGLIMEWVISKQGQPKSYFEFCDEACAYRIGFRFCLCWSVWSVLCIGSAWHIASRQAENARLAKNFYIAKRPVDAEC
uniref:Major facilitator superfamily (MFS) profile domain-containing protein n=1 Tax=Hyaloperonospora arabidopsidis (strain Emoy2) TaxID=559515 RepID=M4BYL5_HYAAE